LLRGENDEGGAWLDHAAVESMTAAPKDWCPHPATRSCLGVRGNSMAPPIPRRRRVGGERQIVIAWQRDKGLTVLRLKRFDHTIVLQSGNVNCESITLSGKQKWKNRGQGAVVDQEGTLDRFDSLLSRSDCTCVFARNWRLLLPLWETSE
jgi:SOS-response transcriptional repressor LexA